MYAQIRLLNGFPNALTYAIPPGLSCPIGTIVRVPLRNKTVSGLVVQTYDQIAKTSYQIKEIIDREIFPHDQQYMPFINRLASYYQIDPMLLIQRIRQFLHQKHTEARETELLEHLPHQKVILTEEQQAVVQFIQPYITQPQYTPALLHGITGSGKTEVYKELMMQATAQGKTSLFLLPEVALALRFEHLLRAQLPSTMPVHGFHSATSAKEKRMLWNMLLEEKPCVIVGVHLPVLLPIPKLGIIIIDEEHDLGYHEKKHPKIHTKEAALLRAQQANIPILLGSATPSTGSLYSVTKKQWHFFQLKKRFAGSLPKITTVILPQDAQRKSFWISRALEKAIADRLEKKEQCIIFLNRRGYSFFVQCGSCSFIFSCQTCSVSLTFHQPHALHCHYCGYNQKISQACPTCATSSESFITKGIGTQQVVNILQDLFPKAIIARADLDTTSKKKSWHETVQKFEQKEIDILVGTQTITKGYHFPSVTLVGLLWADINLHFPFYHAAETTLQQIIQVAGRAGRASHDSEVIIQSMIDHPIFAHVNEQSYPMFYEQEIVKRKTVGYPPAMRFAEIELKHTDEEIIEKEADRLATTLLETGLQLKVQVLGPAKPPVYKIKNTHSRKIYLKSAQISDIIALFRSINKDTFESAIYFTPNPSS